MASDDTNNCPECGEPFERRLSLSGRHGKSIDVSDAEKLCQVAERRTSSGPLPRHESVRVDNERYKFVGYVHV